ncbi:MAG: DUF2071 domain-containing protein, partial [Phycisphaerales bacterium]|nr:DUF2071 domain-containing protein [Phycisphaerales bacterium]
SRLSDEARERFIRCEGTPPLLSDWRETLMIHYEVAPSVLRQDVPFELDLFEGRAFVSLVAFTMSGLRTRRWPRLGRRLFHPIGTHTFLNVRTYVRAGSETGIYFLAEFVPNRLSALLGPPIYGLPYRFARMTYRRANSRLIGVLGDPHASSAGAAPLMFQATIPETPAPRPAVAGSLCEFLMERYTALTTWAGVDRRFRIWHEAWPQTRVDADVFDDRLLHATGAWIRGATICSANYSSGVTNVWMGRPRRLRRGLNDERREGLS